MSIMVQLAALVLFLLSKKVVQSLIENLDGCQIQQYWREILFFFLLILVFNFVLIF
jgi:hypothetical protein